ncbi:uncharacterized protein CC84DRAFT_449064 [Paraphaeosphaeria sporulosa]|uniref:Uncharacterized protein n=1 Tax=Paraphaeosphaeria sporulosa TaxID=1460663 RepID=A0A177CRS3_9PLEO|nr:uncharacterized protein CC84DRAFT_449064 [Paraphaeosphaeria sporulosa]OAG09668.1 hypothetical protein CC84DRAFT_449064 [Paraphaeosphaeria sporulosa]
MCMQQGWKSVGLCRLHTVHKLLPCVGLRSKPKPSRMDAPPCLPVSLFHPLSPLIRPHLPGFPKIDSPGPITPTIPLQIGGAQLGFSAPALDATWFGTVGAPVAVPLSVPRCVDLCPAEKSCGMLEVEREFTAMGTGRRRGPFAPSISQPNHFVGVGLRMNVALALTHTPLGETFD